MAQANTVPSTARVQAETLQQMAEVPAKDVLGTEALEITLRGITDGSVAGSTNDCTFRFDSANDVFVGDASASSAAPLPSMQAVHSATAGDSIVIRRRGKYRMTLGFHQAASSTVLLGVSADVAAGGLIGNPSMATAGMRDMGGGVLPAATSAFHKVTAEFDVSEAEARAGKTVRAHGSDGSNAVVADATILNNTDCYFRVTRIGDLIA